jgi:tRNA(Arg) A34 adenosine deaminase TadA
VESTLEPAMRGALELAWESFAAGSFGIGAVVTDGDGTVVTTGRNRILEHDPGDDVLAGSSLAHAEMNALAKLRYRAHEHADLVLWTTLQPCVQCLGAIRLSSVGHVRVLAPDPLFRGLEEIRHVTPFLGRRWPTITERPIDEWSVFSVLLPTHLSTFWGAPVDTWIDQLPGLCELASDLTATCELIDLARHHDVGAAAATLWPRLADHVAELQRLADS